MSLELFLKGLLIGFSIAAPVGPIGVLCIRRTLADGRAAGLVSGLGAATADGFYGAVAAFGLTAISGFLLGISAATRLLGGLFLCYLGLRTFLSKPAPAASAASSSKEANLQLPSAYLSTLGLTLTNPTTILSFVAVFAGLGLGAETAHDYASAVLMVLGVFIGSALWWITLSIGVGLLRNRIESRAMLWVNRLSGCVIAAFGVAALVSLFFFNR
jgi:threonine/homoserine/homoserine lactone efflux protein